MKNNLYTGFLIILFSLYSITDNLATERQNNTKAARYKTAERFPASASPVDTTQYSIQMEGQSNSIKINGKKMVSTCDTTEKQNNIRVRGEGNTIIIKQTDRQSEVSVTQKGKNNQVKISQK